MDFTERHPDGATPQEVAAELGVSSRRALQLEDRALFKARVARQLLENLDTLRSELPDGCELITAFPRSHDSTGVYVIVSVKVPSMVPASATGLPRGQRRGYERKGK